MFPGEESVAKPRSAVRSEDCEHLGFPVFVVGWPQYLALVQGTGNLVSSPRYYCSQARCRSLTSSLTICSMAFMALFDLSGSLSSNIPPSAVEAICQNRPYLSLSQPQRWGSPPSTSFSHSSSTSSCVSQLTKSDTAGGGGKWGDAVQCDEFLAVKLERRGHDSSFRSRTRVARNT
jgi:hypothetical protein